MPEGERDVIRRVFDFDVTVIAPVGQILQLLAHDAEFLFKELIAGVGQFVEAADSDVGQMAGGAFGDAPNLGDGADPPKLIRDVLFSPMGQKGLLLFAFVVEGDLGQKHIGADSGGGDQPQFFLDVLLNAGNKLLGAAMIKIEIGAEIEEGFVDRVDVEVFVGDIIEEDRNHSRRHLEVVRHPGNGINHAGHLGEIPSAADVGNAIFLFEIRRGRHHDAGGGTIGIAADERGRENVEVAASTLARGIKTLEVDDRDDPFHNSPSWDSILRKKNPRIKT